MHTRTSARNNVRVSTPAILARRSQHTSRLALFADNDRFKTSNAFATLLAVCCPANKQWPRQREKKKTNKNEWASERKHRKPPTLSAWTFAATELINHTNMFTPAMFYWYTRKLKSAVIKNSSRERERGIVSHLSTTARINRIQRYVSCAESPNCDEQKSDKF